MKTYDIFISYRRDAYESANLIATRLRAAGYRVFFDLESMRSGLFNEQLFDVIDKLLSFIKNTLDIRQVSEDYMAFQSNYPLDVNSYDSQRYNMNHLYMGDYKKLNSYSGDILRVVLGARMSLANEIMLMADSLFVSNGYIKTPSNLWNPC
ncbi:MAG: toll/interleukin-1 receptor domain-containing protein [Bacteroidales bacterium]|nr:toll/interleukin-1 receptor domain-containing protein [Bacteroidales bacterium]